MVYFDGQVQKLVDYLQNTETNFGPYIMQSCNKIWLNTRVEDWIYIRNQYTRYFIMWCPIRKIPFIKYLVHRLRILSIQESELQYQRPKRWNGLWWTTKVMLMSVYLHRMQTQNNSGQLLLVPQKLSPKMISDAVDVTLFIQCKPKKLLVSTNILGILFIMD